MKHRDYILVLFGLLGYFLFAFNSAPEEMYSRRNIVSLLKTKQQEFNNQNCTLPGCVIDSFDLVARSASASFFIDYDGDKGLFEAGIDGVYDLSICTATRATTNDAWVSSPCSWIDYKPVGGSWDTLPGSFMGSTRTYHWLIENPSICIRLIDSLYSGDSLRFMIDNNWDQNTGGTDSTNIIRTSSVVIEFIQ